MRQIEVKAHDADDYLFPTGDDESALVGALFEKATELYPDWPMGDRTDLAMAMFGQVKRWAHNLQMTSSSHKIVDMDEEGS